MDQTASQKEADFKWGFARTWRNFQATGKQHGHSMCSLSGSMEKGQVVRRFACQPKVSFYPKKEELVNGRVPSGVC